MSPDANVSIDSDNNNAFSLLKESIEVSKESIEVSTYLMSDVGQLLIFFTTSNSKTLT